ncbi:MAG: four helix bundle suffix domain-containing protein [Planctomycetes bacterium]|nr:four helix bundle suffix domain-containing protein [Planctomycetota bacterium]
MAHGGHRDLYQGTVCFCERFLNKRDRTVDQMVQAARSGKQNIAEGSMASGTSRGTEIKLVGVARASLEELLRDYHDLLAIRDLDLWQKDSRPAKAARKLAYADNETYIEQRSPETVANILICLIHQANDLLDRQIKSLENAFLKGGGIRERMMHSRIAERNRRQKHRENPDL